MNKKPISIYFHWPFCVSKCPYCDFNTHIQRKIDQKEWEYALKVELNYFIKNILSNNNENYYLRSIFFGGGTPSLMDPKVIRKLIDYCKEKFQLLDPYTDPEITLEANPSSILKAGCHSFDSSTLVSYCDIDRPNRHVLGKN